MKKQVGNPSKQGGGKAAPTLTSAAASTAPIKVMSATVLPEQEVRDPMSFVLQIDCIEFILIYRF